jgi:hypothetical protein
MKRIAFAALLALGLNACANDRPTESLGSLRQQLSAVDSFCYGKDGDVYPECPINRSLLQAQLRDLTVVEAGIPPPPPRTPEEEAAIIARTYKADQEWQAKGTLGRVAPDYGRQIAFVRRSGALFRNPNLDPDGLDLAFRSIPYPGIVCGIEAWRNEVGIYEETAQFAAYFTPGGKLSRLSEPVPIVPKQYKPLYADRLNGPFAASDEAALFRICGIVPGV